MTAVAPLANTSAINMNESVQTLVIPFVAASGKCVVVHIGVQSEEAAVASVTDDSGNGFTKSAAIRAVHETDYTDTDTTDDPHPIYDSWVDGELWTIVSSGIASITVTLTTNARFAVEVQSYTSSGFGAVGSTTAIQSSAPSITVTTTAANSYVCAGFSSVYGLNDIIVTGTKRGDVEEGTEVTDLQVFVADNTVASAGPCTVKMTVTNQDTDEAPAVIFPVPATYAVCAVEILA